jgi:hypothetical protein
MSPNAQCCTSKLTSGNSCGVYNVVYIVLWRTGRCSGWGPRSTICEHSRETPGEKLAFSYDVFSKA